jgi:Tfp pilus assembly ATPase PilU
MRPISMTDKPAPTPPHEPLQLPSNFVDKTAEKIGTVIGIVGATGAGKGAPKQPMPN